MDIIEFLKLCLIGFIQGFTEPLPISSSAHMLFIDHYLKLNVTDLNFEIIINLASTLAIIFFFRKKIWALIKNTFSKANIKDDEYNYLNRKFFLMLLLGSLPAVIGGLFFSDYINMYLISYKFAAICLLLTSIILFITYLMLKKKQPSTTIDNITTMDSITIGLMQMLALLPGISRSGSTLFGGITRDLSIKKTLDFSFFLYIIASLGAFILSCFKLEWSSINFLTLIIPFVIAFITTLFSIKWFYGKLNARLILLFTIYCLIVSTLILIF